MAEKKRPLFFAYDPASPTDIHVWFSIGSRSYDTRTGWVNANLTDVTRMAKGGLFDTLVVHTPGSGRSVRYGEQPISPPRITVTADIEPTLDIVRQMGPPWSPPKPKPKLQIPFDQDGNQLHRGPRVRRSYEIVDPPSVVWRENHEFVATMTFGLFVYGGSAASYVHLRDEHGRDYQMFLNGLEKAIHHVNRGKLSGRFEFCRRGESFGVRFLESQEDMDRKLDKRLEGDVKPTHLRW